MIHARSVCHCVHGTNPVQRYASLVPALFVQVLVYSLFMFLCFFIFIFPPLCPLLIFFLPILFFLLPLLVFFFLRICSFSSTSASCYASSSSSSFSSSFSSSSSSFSSSSSSSPSPFFSS